MESSNEGSAMTTPVRMYSTAVCPFCVMAERLLRSKGVTEIEKIRIDLDPAARQDMMTKTGRRTVPQIYIGDRHVGGYDDLAALDRQGGLVPLLDSNGAAAA
jgi:glutaredoxin 3